MRGPQRTARDGCRACGGAGRPRSPHRPLASGPRRQPPLPPPRSALCMVHIPPQIPVRAMLVAHNSDYNGTWPVWSKARRAGGCPPGAPWPAAPPP